MYSKHIGIALAITIIILTSTNFSHAQTWTHFDTPGSAPVVGFYGSPTSGYSLLTVSFIDTSTNNPTSWSWSFGDGITSSQQNPNHIYLSPGNYSVSLAVSNSFGTDSIIKTNYISVLSTVTTGFTISGFVLDTSGNPVSGMPIWIRDEGVQYCPPIGDFDSTGPFQVETDSTGYYQFAGLCIQCYQVLPLGNEFETFTPSYRNYNPLTSDQNYANFTVTYLPIPGPIAFFTALPLSGYGPLSVNFTDNTSDLYGNSTTWSWDFGDGAISNLQNPAHVYSTVENPTSYTVQLIVTTNYGTSTSIRTNYITVSEPGPSSFFTGAPTFGYSPLTVYFFDGSDNLNGTSTSWNWDFGDGLTSNIQNPIHIFRTMTAVTPYTVRLIVTTNYGISTSTQKNYVIVFPRVTFDTSTDTTFWAFENAPDFSNQASVSWSSSYQNHAGLITMNWSQATQGVKMTSFDRFTPNPAQPWYRVRVTYCCDSPCDGESIIPVILTYSDNTSQKIQEVAGSYTGNSLIQSGNWYTLEAYIYCRASSGQLQLIMKNSGSSGAMHIDTIELANSIPPAISHLGYLALMPGVPMNAGSDTTYWGFDPVANTNSKPEVSWLSNYDGQNNVLELNFSSSIQGVKITSLLGTIPTNRNAILSFDINMTYPLDIVAEGFVYGEESINPLVADIAGYANVGIIPANTWTTLYVPLSSVSLQSTFRVQLLVKNINQFPEQVYIDNIQFFYSSTVGYDSLLVKED